MIDIGVLVDKLNNFESPDEIAFFFQREGIKARQFRSTACAVSKWIEQESGIKVTTARSHVVALNNTEELYGLESTVSLFVARFDAGRYPDLVEAEYYLAFEG